MNNAAKYLMFLLAAWLLVEGCAKKETEKKNWPITLRKEDKDAYGTYLFHKTLPYYWRHAKIEDISQKFRYTNLDDDLFYNDDSVSMLVMVGLDYFITDEEWAQLKSFANAGNELLIIGGKIDGKICSDLGINQYGGYEEQPLANLGDSSIYHSGLRLMDDSTRTYGYHGKFIGGYFTIDGTTTAEPVIDSSGNANSTEESTSSDVSSDQAFAETYQITRPEVLGTNRIGPDFIRCRIGAGGITLHTAPLAFSNYFLLQNGNRNYLDGVWRQLPANIAHIYYNEYFKRSTEATDMSVLMKHPATKWALILGICLMLVYVLFGLKRRQRIVPVLKKVQNESASFVETVGRLYYNKGNHANLAEKMIQHFLEWVRTYYYIDTTQLNEHFIQQLQSKSGKSEGTVRDMVQRIHDVRLNAVAVTPEYLYELHELTQSFYNK